jgi:hypothetical protein
MWMLVENEACRGAGHPQQPHQEDMDYSYSEFLVTHSPLFSESSHLLEVDNWLYTTESKIGLLHCTEYQKTLYITQQLRGSAVA